MMATSKSNSPSSVAKIAVIDGDDDCIDDLVKATGVFVLVVVVKADVVSILLEDEVDAKSMKAAQMADEPETVRNIMTK